MNNRCFITLCIDVTNQKITLELPGNEPLQVLLKEILMILGWPETLDGKRLDYQFKSENQVINLSDTIISAGIDNFQSVWLNPPREIESIIQSVSVSPEEEAEEISKQIPFWVKSPPDSPALVSPKGIIFLLGQDPILIGRNDEGNTVNIDLSEVEENVFVSSRRHAEIFMENGNYIMKALKTTNGTFINGSELSAGDLHNLKNNDRIQFGLKGVKLVFLQPQS